MYTPVRLRNLIESNVLPNVVPESRASGFCGVLWSFLRIVWILNSPRWFVRQRKFARACWAYWCVLFSHKKTPGDSSVSCPSLDGNIVNVTNRFKTRCVRTQSYIIGNDDEHGPDFQTDPICKSIILCKFVNQQTKVVHARIIYLITNISRLCGLVMWILLRCKIWSIEISDLELLTMRLREFMLVICYTYNVTNRVLLSK